MTLTTDSEKVVSPNNGPDDPTDETPWTTIPRIIHAIGSFDEMPTMLTHPDWIRVQNTWRLQSGYEYHAYATIGQQRHWVERNYPPVFLKAYEFLNGDVRQAQFFALLVMFRKGGMAAYSE